MLSCAADRVQKVRARRSAAGEEALISIIGTFSLRFSVRAVIIKTEEPVSGTHLDQRCKRYCSEQPRSHAPPSSSTLARRCPCLLDSMRVLLPTRPRAANRL